MPSSIDFQRSYLTKRKASKRARLKSVEAVSSNSQSLQALTSAALMLPGLMLGSAQAADGDRINFQYSRYQEGKRDLFNVPNNLAPISADVLHGSGIFSLTDRTKFNFSYTQDTWSGATPIAISPLAAGGNKPIYENTPFGATVVGASPIINNNFLTLDRNLIPLARENGALIQDPRSVMTMSSASPETRHQATFGVTREWNEAALNMSGGFSSERDYQSSFGNINGRFDLNQKLTSIKYGAGYSSSEIGAIIDHDASPYITKTAFLPQIKFLGGGNQKITGERQDWNANLGTTHILNKNALIEANVGYTHSHGYLENPYKVMTAIFINPADLGKDSINGDMRALLEQRPNFRNQIALSTQYIRYVEPFDAALHLGYRFSTDDWHVNTHTFDANWVQPLGGGWMLTPRIRYYSQDAASFFQPYLFTLQSYSRNYDTSKLPDNFSSDHRLAGFGSLSGGLSISKLLRKGVALEAGFEYYTRASAMQIGGGGNNGFADFDYLVANAAVKFDVDALPAALPIGSGGSRPASSVRSDTLHAHHHKLPPAGIMFGHMLSKPGDFMAGYRFMHSWAGGNMMHGAHPVSDQTIVEQGCGEATPCRYAPTFMNMRMHMLDLMYAPTKWFNIMLMPTFMDMNMNLRELSGAPAPKPGQHIHNSASGHETGALSDTYFSALIKLLDIAGHRIHVNLGMSAPTGKTDIELRRTNKVDGGLIHFGMQLGSGTWDFMPSMTYAGEYRRWSWGAQLYGVKRLEDKNKSGYRLGDLFQASTWGGVDLMPWLTASVRGLYTWQGAIHRSFDAFNARIGPMDFPFNYGGQFWDLGFGVNARIPGGRFAGNRLGFEWIQPISSDFNGFQIDRQGMLAATWSYQF